MTAEIAFLRDGAASPAALRQACRRCREPFTPRQSGGHPQRFCSPICRRAHDAAARVRGRAEIEAEQATIPGIGNGARPTRALEQQHETPAAALSSGETDDPALPDAPARFLVEVSCSAVDLLVKGRWLRPGERDDVLAILLAMKRVGLAASVMRIT